jgi:transcriptional regulator with XRE-family HTH domain
MDRSSAVGEYLRARRALLAPEEVGFVPDRNRQVVGLRREEVAVLAGISPEYYLRLEQGRDHQPSDQVLVALARALRLGPHGESYLRRLVRPAPRTTDGDPAPVRHGHLDDVLAQWRDVPAFVADQNLDVVASNPLADELGGHVFSPGANRLLTMFEHEGAPRVVPDWETQARELVGAFRMSGDPDDLRHQEIVGRLSMRSPDFRRIWSRQDVHVFVEGTCLLPLPPFGLVEFGWRNFAVAGHPGHVLTTFSAWPGTPAVPVLAYFAARASQRRGHGTPRAPAWSAAAVGDRRGAGRVHPAHSAS